MRNVHFAILLVTAMFLVQSCSADREISFEQLQERSDGLTYAVNEEEPFSGTAVKYYKTEQKKLASSFEDGLLSGSTTEWYSDGQKKSEVEYGNGNRHGLTIVWYPNGQQRLEEEYVDGKRSGSYQEWYENGQLLVKKSYENDLSDGLLTSWYDNGQIGSEGNLTQDKQDGPWVFWYDNGHKKEEMSFKEGVGEGLRRDWYENGNMQFDGYMKEDKLDGKCTFWYENGQMQAEGNYDNGYRNGLCTFWYENGQTKRIANYSNDKIVSDLQLWKENGDKIGVGEVADVDGNKYLTVEIGDQWWMMENLKVTHYRNMDPIKKISGKDEWRKFAYRKKVSTLGAYMEYSNDSLHVDTYGRLYNFYAAIDEREIAPEGWHVPTSSDWKQLIKYLGENGGNKLKEEGIRHWKTQNEGLMNESGFNAIPSGFWENKANWSTAQFKGLGQYAFYWDVKDKVAYKSGACYAHIHADSENISLNLTDTDYGLAVRCVKD